MNSVSAVYKNDSLYTSHTTASSTDTEEASVVYRWCKRDLKSPVEVSWHHVAAGKGHRNQKQIMNHGNISVLFVFSLSRISG